MREAGEVRASMSPCRVASIKNRAAAEWRRKERKSGGVWQKGTEGEKESNSKAKIMCHRGTPFHLVPNGWKGKHMHPPVSHWDTRVAYNSTLGCHAANKAHGKGCAKLTPCS